MKILGINGSLRKESINRAALVAFGEAIDDKAIFEIAELHGIPLYNQDIQADGFPEAVEALVTKIGTADAVVFGTPEYNYSISGVLKNAIDWLSRHPGKPLAGKAALIIGASPGGLGTARAQYHLRQIGVFLDIRFLNKPEIMIGNAFEKFKEGKLIHTETKEHLQKAVSVLLDFAKKA